MSAASSKQEPLVVHDMTLGIDEAREALCAMRRGEVDALVVMRGEDPRVVVLTGADLAQQVLFETLSEGALILGADATVLSANRTLLDLLGVAMGELAGREIRTFVVPEDAPRFAELMAQAAGGSSKGEVRVRTARGDVVPTMLSIRAVESGEQSVHTVVVTNLTPLKRAQAELERANEELEMRVAERTRELRDANDALRSEIEQRMRLEAELRTTAGMLLDADRRKDEFLSMLAHELRNPLAPLVTALELLERVGGAEPAAVRYRAVIARQAATLTRLVDDLLEVSRITRRRIALQKKVVDLRAIVGRAAEASRPAIDAGHHALAVLLPGQPVRVLADPTRIEQVVVNLLNNAAKYTPAGGRIEISVTEDAGEGVVRVRDNGIGIAAELLPRVFDLFVQSDRSLDRSQGGLGIGLTLVKSIVELHDGTALAQSEGIGKGSEFTFRLPITEARIEEPAPDRAAPPPAPVRRRVLVVEDNADAAETLADLLRAWGCEVRAARSAAEALRETSSFDPEVVLIDVGLPGMDGYELARRLRRQGAPRKLIGLSGYGQESDRARGAEAGFDHHLVKPAPPDVLRRLLDAA